MTDSLTKDFESLEKDIKNLSQISSTIKNLEEHLDNAQNQVFPQEKVSQQYLSNDRILERALSSISDTLTHAEQYGELHNKNQKKDIPLIRKLKRLKISKTLTACLA